jgi:hypothetical protein
MIGMKSRRRRRATRGLLVLAAGLAAGALCAAGAAPSFYHEGYARGRAGTVAIATAVPSGMGISAVQVPLMLAQTQAAGAGVNARASASAAGAGASEAAAGQATGGSGVSRISPARSIGASLILPGWGQHLTGHSGRARVFLATEAALIATFIGFRVQGEVRQDRYSDYAGLFAGVENAKGKSDGYYRNLGRYMSAADYEDDLARDARARFGDDIAQREAYVAARRPRPDEAWQWESRARREAFTEMRKESRSSFHRADQVIGVILLNHVLSAVDAGRLSRKGASGKALYVSPGPEGMNYVGLTWPLDE